MRVSGQDSYDEAELIELIADSRADTAGEATDAATFGPLEDELKQHAPITYRHFVLGDTYKEIGLDYGISNQAAYQRAVAERKKPEWRRIVKRMRDIV